MKNEISKMWSQVIRPAMLKNRIYKQKTLAEKAGVSKATIGLLKYNPSAVSLDTLAKVANTLKINIANLMVYRETK